MEDVCLPPTRVESGESYCVCSVEDVVTNVPTDYLVVFRSQHLCEFVVFKPREKKTPFGAKLSAFMLKLAENIKIIRLLMFWRLKTMNAAV